MSLSAKELALFYGAKAKVIKGSKQGKQWEYIDSHIHFFQKGDVKTISPAMIESVERGYIEVKPILHPLSDNEKGVRSGSNPQQVLELLEENKDVFNWIPEDKAISALELEQSSIYD